MSDRDLPDKIDICCGGHISPPCIRLKAGCLSMIYEDGNIRYVSAAGNEIIRMIYSAVRDKEWLTIAPVISEEKIESHADSFNLEYRCNYVSGGISFSAFYKIEGKSDNSLIFSFEGEALSTFEKCRIGFCVLHPVEGCSGRPCIITHSDGNPETNIFPVEISPDQPFTDIKSMNWNVGGSECSLSFSGDIFETEDQRNWTDASYKTYCTPLSLPRPATIRQGEKISQRIELKLLTLDSTGGHEKEDIFVSINNSVSSVLPFIGIGRSTRPSPLTEDEFRILRNLRFDHYRADLYLFKAGWQQEADLASYEGAALNYPLELAIFFDENYPAQLNEFIEWMTVRMPVISVVSLFHLSETVLPDKLIETIASILRVALPDIKIACGTNANFAQINRQPPASANTDYICYSIHPQEHASDNTTIVENLQSQVYTVSSARRFAQGKGIWISPVNIRRRFNANVENYESQITSDSFPTQADSRLMSVFGGCWAAGSVKYLCEAGVSGITFFETVGERGITQGSFDSRWPAEFKTNKGMIFPVFHLFAWLLKERSFGIVESISSRPLEVECLALTDGSRLKLALSNFTSSHKSVLINGLKGSVRSKVLNAESYASASTDEGWIDKDWQNVSGKRPIVLEPFSLNFFEVKPVDR